MNPETTGRSPRHFLARRLLVVLASSLIGLALALGLVAGLDALNRVRAAWAATTITVNTTNDELNSDGDCSLREAIQAANTNVAVDACPAGSGADTINLPAGTYTLTLAGAGEDANATGDLDIIGPLTLDGADMATTIINANALDRAMHVPTAGMTLALLNLTVRNGNVGDYGGGLYAAGPVVVSNTTFFSNTAGLSGGGAAFDGAATVTVTGTTFLSNTAPNGGGAYFAYGAATVTGTTFLGNAASGGGGAFFYFGAATVTGTTFLSNTASSYGGGAVFGGPATVMGTTFFSNTASSNSGGAYFRVAAAVMGTIFLGNTASYGGGAFFEYGPATVAGTTFLSNAAGYGGGAYFYGAAVVTGTTFVSNTAGYGGGAYFGGTTTVTGASFTDNTALNDGGGVYFRGSTGDFVNTLLVANRVYSGRGAALYVYFPGFGDPAVVTLRHVTIAGPTVGSGSAVYVLASVVNITNTIVASYSVGLERAGGALNENYNLFSGVATPYSGMVASGGNSITSTAAFADATLYKLTTASAAVDSGTDVGVTTDFEGDPRPAGAGFDIGWDEKVPDVPISGLSASNDSPKQVVQAIHFTATISAGTGVIYQWNFGDGQVGNGATTTHTYVAPGNYTAIVTATNSEGSVSASTPVTITEAAFKLYLPLITRSASPSGLAPQGGSAKRLRR